MKRIIHHMRTRPAHEQHRFSLFMAGSLTVVIALIWVATSRASLTLALQNPTPPEVRGPIALIGEQISFVAGRVTALFQTAQKQD